MYIPSHALEGLRIWAMLWGQNSVDFKELQDADMLRFFVFDEYTTRGYLKRGQTKHISSYSLTDKALEVIREGK